jgi:hypothetical protein
MWKKKKAQLRLLGLLLVCERPYEKNHVPLQILPPAGHVEAHATITAHRPNKSERNKSPPTEFRNKPARYKKG